MLQHFSGYVKQQQIFESFPLEIIPKKNADSRNTVSRKKGLTRNIQRTSQVEVLKC